MSITQTSNTNTSLTSPSDEISFVVLPYAKKLKVSLSFDPDQDRTQQEFVDECDINNIMARYMKTGVIDFVNQHEPQYGDATGWEFQEAQNVVVSAKNMFSDLPAKIRERFGNDPAKFLDFINDDENRVEAAKMGLLSPEKAQEVLNPTYQEKTSPEAPNPSGEDGK